MITTNKWLVKGRSLFFSFMLLVAFESYFSCTTVPTCQPDQIVPLDFRDGKGRDLLSPTTPGYFHKRDIKTFTLSNGIRTLYTDSALSSSGRLLFAEGLPTEPITVVVRMEQPTMLLQLSAVTIDTIKVIQIGNCPKMIDKVWYNSKQVYDRSLSLPLQITIVKP
jgi:hypothetical protein